MADDKSIRSSDRGILCRNYAFRSGACARSPRTLTIRQCKSCTMCGKMCDIDTSSATGPARFVCVVRVRQSTWKVPSTALRMFYSSEHAYSKTSARRPTRCARVCTKHVRGRTLNSRNRSNRTRACIAPLIAVRKSRDMPAARRETIAQ